jgi:hypothetical protein
MQVEATEGCNLRCSFCGIRGIREAGGRGDLSGPYRFMTPATAALAAQQARQAMWNPRVEFAMHGEPAANPDLPLLVSAFRQALPRAPIMITTNGIPLLGRWRSAVSDLYDAGADTIAVDNYRPYRCEPSVLGTVLPGVGVYRYPQGGPLGNPHRRPARHERRLVLVQDISQAEDGTHAHLSNHAGAAGPPDPSRDRERCALPFREISVRWDGSVALCCNDWRGAYKAGTVADPGLPAIWEGPAFAAARSHLYRATRDFAPCQGCTHRTYRNGLLPDKHGREDWPAPTADDEAAIAAALEGDPYTAPVRRKWELPVVEVT